MTRFILNNSEIVTREPTGMPLLEFIRYHQHLTGTKTGCNEGDCGACTVLVGDLLDGRVNYKSYTSCLTPLGKVHGKHVVTIEGLNKNVATGENSSDSLNSIQKAMYDESATQCGFCTPGFVVSLAGYCLSEQKHTKEGAIAAIDGNICRCTGYKSIQRAAYQVAELMQSRNGQSSIDFATQAKLLPGYFSGIAERLVALKGRTNGELDKNGVSLLVGGGTDLYVQKHDDIKDSSVHFFGDDRVTSAVFVKEDKCFISSDATVTDLVESGLFNKYFPEFNRHVKLVSSTQIRNMATIAGNFVNGSPIGDFTIFFLALDAQLILKDSDTTREIPLRNFYKGYKTLDKTPAEYIHSVYFRLPAPGSFFNFEKVSKRTNLDIASVNSAIQLSIEDDHIRAVGISAGGVGPVPLFLEKTSAFLQGKEITTANINQAVETAQTEISPISDARGSAEYKRLLLGQLIKCHFIEFFPNHY